MKILLILQGASGSGKSTLAQHLKKRYNAVIRSTDDQLMEDGKYNFRVEKLGEAHKENLRLATADMEDGRNVIIDNTNTQCWEAREYVKVGVKFGYDIRFIRCEGRFSNVHGVPEEKVEAMRGRMEVLTVEGCLGAIAPWEKK